MIEELKRIVNKIDQFDISKNSLSYLNFLVLDLQNGFKSIQTIYGQIGCCISMDKKIFIFKDFINEFNSRNENDTKEIYQKNNPFFIKFINNKKNEFVYKIKNDINILEQEIQKRKIINNGEAYPFSTGTQPIKLPIKNRGEIRKEKEERDAMQALENIQKREFIGGNYNLDEKQKQYFKKWKEKKEKLQKLNIKKHIIEPPKFEQIDNQFFKQIDALKRKGNIDNRINAHNQVMQQKYQQQMDLAIKRIEKEAKEVGRRVYYKQILQKERIDRLNNRISNFGQSIHDNNIVKQHIDFLYRQKLNNYNNRPQQLLQKKQNLNNKNQIKMMLSNIKLVNKIDNLQAELRKKHKWPLKQMLNGIEIAEAYYSRNLLNKVKNNQKY